MKDELGERIKSQYENRTRYSLPRRTYSIIRIDGKAFHSYTRGLKRPFDEELIEDLDKAVINSLRDIQGAQFAYLQSDEISILLTDFEKTTTDAWFDGNIQKNCSVSASLMTAEFNNLRLIRTISGYVRKSGISVDFFYDRFDTQVITGFSKAYFDSRVFTIPDKTEVYNYFIWRWKDCCRNSISMVAQSNFSHRELHGKSSSQQQDMLMEKGINWSKLPEHHKNGRFIVKEQYEANSAIRNKWVSKPGWKLTENPSLLQKMIPDYA